MLDTWSLGSVVSLKSYTDVMELNDFSIFFLFFFFVKREIVKRHHQRALGCAYIFCI